MPSKKPGRHYAKRHLQADSEEFYFQGLKAMSTNRETLLCRYHYDPLDRLAACTLSEEQESTQRFYLKSRLATEIQGSVQRSIFQHDDQLLAQQQRQGGTVETTLFATDQQRSVVNALDATQPHPIAYTPYGHRPPDGGLLSLLGFNGERPDPVTGHYVLGNGYQAFNPVLMRFNSPDSWSPFREGGLNAYGYCLGDPVNREDPTGHIGNPFKGFLNMLGRTPRSARANNAFEAAVEIPVSAPTTQTTTAPAGPPPYTFEPSARPYSGMSHQELNASPPTYSQSQTPLAPPPYTSNETVFSSGVQSSSTPNLERPPPYFEGTTRVRPGRNQSRVDELRAHRQRIRDNTSHLPQDQLPSSVIDTLANIRQELTMLRGQR
jgi:RHS repeat-associated protein